MTIKKLRFYCHKVLPLVYDDSLSYYELLCKVVYKINEMIENPSGITVADPVEWSITSQYPANTMVIDSDGTAYLSKQPVPVGIDISNEDYWQPIFNYSGIVSDLREQIAYSTEIDNTTVDLAKDDLVFVRGELYKALSDITAGSLLIPDTNIVKYTVNERFADFGTIEAELAGRIDDVEDDLSDEVDAREQADIDINARIDALPAHVYVVPEDYGAVGDGNADDTAALQACFDVGKPVYLANSYKINNVVTYTGCEIFGNGNIYVNSLPSNVSSAIKVQSDDVKISGIKIDCNSNACIGLHIICTRNVTVKDVTVANTQTTYYGTNSGSVGIFVESSSKCEISQCYIHDLNRTSGTVNVHSTAGIVVYARNNIYVHDNLIERIRSNISYYDCDGIYVTYIESTDITTAIIENNKLFDCTGRFIKSQCTYTVVRNNYGELVTEFVPNDRYFNCVSIQRGSFEIVNNYFNLHNNVHRGYTRCISLEIYDTKPRTGIIIGNTILAKTGGSYPETMRCYLNITSTDAANNSVDITMCNNIFRGRTESSVSLNASYAINGIIKIMHNITNMYQVIECAGGYTDFDKLFVDCEYNDNNLYNQTSRLSPETAVFTMLKYRYNLSLNESINNYPISYSALQIFEGYYRGSIQAMQDLPSGIARGDYLFMIKSPAVTEFKSFADTSSGYILN